ncbi:hypothetical protein AVEN_138364-1 [Araneus ventricosus]|uniref:Uncharacterized protein n=1 Tax=Araneus ventricosus TaxID=182803 RepID=A0A4Y2X376_ARAVE|nr:hypothetical protein AVEN_138364-1 [Araneus ventricosus]
MAPGSNPASAEDEHVCGPVARQICHRGSNVLPLMWHENSERRYRVDREGEARPAPGENIVCCRRVRSAVGPPLELPGDDESRVT